MDKYEFGKKMSDVLTEIEGAMWERDFIELGPQGYTDEGFRSGIKIFMSVLMDRMWVLQEQSKLTQKEREKLALSAGNELRKLILKYTGVDTHNLYGMDKTKQ